MKYKSFWPVMGLLGDPIMVIILAAFASSRFASHLKQINIR